MTKARRKREFEKLWNFFRQNGRCLLCCEAMFLDIPADTFGGVTREHKLPLIRGGADNRANRALSHRECNWQRSDRTKLKFMRPEHPMANPKQHFGSRRVVRSHGIWWSHFRLPVSWRQGEVHGESNAPDRGRHAG